MTTPSRPLNWLPELMTNSRHPQDPTKVFVRQDAPDVSNSAKDRLEQQFQSILAERDVRWTVRYRLLNRLGSGSQGVVFLAERLGAHNISLPVALKVFSPKNHADSRAYRREMERQARVTMQLALIQQDHLLDVINFIQCRGVRVLVMEWIDGFDLRYLLLPQSLWKMQHRLSPERYASLNDVIITSGPECSRLKPGIAIAVLRECLSALAAMHRHGIVHADLKPANIMLKRTGNAKVVDFGFSFEIGDRKAPRACTPRYAAVEVLRGEPNSPASDLASLGYVLLELLSGRTPFAGLQRFVDLIEAKSKLPNELSEWLPAEIAHDERLLALLRGLIAPDPADRFPNADAANFQPDGAAHFHRELVKDDLSSEYENDIRVWLSEVE